MLVIMTIGAITCISTPVPRFILGCRHVFCLGISLVVTSDIKPLNGLHNKAKHVYVQFVFLGADLCN